MTYYGTGGCTRMHWLRHWPAQPWPHSRPGPHAPRCSSSAAQTGQGSCRLATAPLQGGGAIAFPAGQPCLDGTVPPQPAQMCAHTHILRRTHTHTRPPVPPAPGCIFHYDDDKFQQGNGVGFKESDTPNFTGSYYSHTKAIVENLLKVGGRRPRCAAAARAGQLSLAAARRAALSRAGGWVRESLGLW
jgi:hypothetical protein